ncbi:hypothetical protein PVAG01_08133 [Phlyctema vagabunda]|uniref:Large ribosomal subunit protein mL67 n=1 Tax=Phlyctema vagabunda TaxID=108571 RepID=A0ABR4P8J1_9HELO
MAGGHRMVARRAKDHARRAIQSAEAIAAHQAWRAAQPREEKVRIPTIDSEHGRRIYVWNHIQTNQVVYSLTQATKNREALKQIPYNGKKTVPSALRKDLWMPLCQITFPQATELPAAPPTVKKHGRGRTKPTPKPENRIGLAAFQKLREYKMRHQLEWDPEVLGKDPETGYFINKKIRGRLIRDQKANSVADLAAVLTEVTGVDGVQDKEVIVKWSNLLDAEFADSWSGNIVHDTLEYSKNNRKNFVPEEAEEDQEFEGEEAEFEQPLLEGEKLGEDIVVQEKKSA